MKHLVLLALALALALGLSFSGAPAAAGDRTIGFASDDPKMRAAIAQARATLPRFLDTVFASGKRATTAASLKVSFDLSDGGAEIIWVDNLQRKGKGYIGTLANRPNRIPGKQLGDKVRFSNAQIADWGLMQGGKLYGHYTTRVLLPGVDQKTRAMLAVLLSRTPAPSGW